MLCQKKVVRLDFPSMFGIMLRFFWIDCIRKSSRNKLYFFGSLCFSPCRLQGSRKARPVGN